MPTTAPKREVAAAPFDGDGNGLTLEYCFLSQDEPHHPPLRVYADDAGFDLYISRGMQIMPGCWGVACTNLAVRIPLGYWGLIQARGATHRRRRLFISSGKIDQGYHGEVTASVFNPASPADKKAQTALIKPGESLFQLILVPLNVPLLKEVAAFPKADITGGGAQVRGERGL